MTPQTQSATASEKPVSSAHHGATQGSAHTEEQHRSVVAIAAYYLAERRQFAPGFEVQDWLAAEKQVSGAGE
jgi:hypothetical protein